MDTSQRKISKITNKLPASNLKSEDIKFVAELVQYIGVLNGRNNLQISIHDSFNSKYKVIIAKMPEINFDDIRQIEMMNKRINEIIIDLDRGFLIIESWKYGKEKKSSSLKKRRRLDDDYTTLPKTFNLKHVDKNDTTQVEGVLKLFLNYTELEFSVDLQQTGNTYDLSLSQMEPISIISIDAVLTKFKAFINQVTIDYPKKALKVSVRKTDSPLEKIAPYRRKLKLQRKD
tara:strand:- start:1270 stop:1962 length:693 start_codon:yes stop_codon:yes gene_type:complete